MLRVDTRSLFIIPRKCNNTDVESGHTQFVHRRLTTTVFTFESRYLEPQGTEKKFRVTRSSTKEECKNSMSIKGKVFQLHYTDHNGDVCLRIQDNKTRDFF